MSTWDGRWRNELGSEMEISVDGGRVSGVYRTQVGRPDAAEQFAVTGFAHEDLIGIVAQFGEHGSVTSWTGRRTEGAGGDEIRVLWHLARNTDDAGETLPAWASILAGSAVFRRA